ncbi:unnamed protein product [Dicrocoelium dendriticum]|nr:unnamed protein product [Dicrocoelium dendriticum]
MNYGSSRIPKVVTVRVQKAVGLRIIPKSEAKQKKLTSKWKVVFLGGKKKMSTSSVWAPAGDPFWDYEVTFKVAARGEPICLLVTDSEDHHVGQVVIPVTAMQPRPANPNERPTDPSRLKVSELEPTKKVENPFGSLHYWVWVEEYRTDGDALKSRTGSALSLQSWKHDKKHASVADSLNYSGSVLSIDPGHLGSKDDKRPYLLKRKHMKDVFKSAADLSQRPSISVSAKRQSIPSRGRPLVFDRINGGNSQSTCDSLSHDHDGSVLGASSDLTGSELYHDDRQLNVNLSRVSSHTRSAYSPFVNKPPDEHSSSVRSHLSTSNADSNRQREDKTAIRVGDSDSPKPNSSGLKPALLSVKPTSCPTTGGVEVTVRCTGLTQEVMRYASILVDGYVVPRQDWYFDDSEGVDDAGVVDLRIVMPERPTGTCWIELETINHGRLRCDQEFTYMPLTSTHKVPEIRNSLVPAAMSSESGTPSVLSRTGSQRSSLIVRDRRSERRTRLRPGVMPKTTAEVDLPEEHKALHDDLTQLEKRRSSNAGSVISQPLSFHDSGVESLREASETIDSHERSDENLFPHQPLDHEPIDVFRPKPDAASVTRQLSEDLEPIQSSDSSEERLKVDDHLSVGERLRNSTRSISSELSKSVVDEDIALENRGLRAMLTEANQLMDAMRRNAVDLEQKLSLKTAEVEHLSLELCTLRNRLLKDGVFKYLEKPALFY